ncbi:Pre-mRNA splicing factor PRP21 like protein-domain-containing protein [Gongronella butleri]|nr:Pre-mRNA splicing factor PRP21 like protein-domain-containing protein [Gongronella butleri]
MATASEQAMPMDVDQPQGSNGVAGLIYPPPDVRKKVDKVAELLWNKGPNLEERIRENEKHNPIFSFLNPTDPFHAYYQYRLRQARDAAENGTSSEMTAAGISSSLKNEKAAETVEEAAVAPPEPPAYDFSVPMPAMSAKDLDVIKLTARFAARNGRQFIHQLAQRESRNYQFDFLRPSHSLFPFFTELIRQYSKVLVPSDTIDADLHRKQSKSKMIELIRERVEFTIWDAQEKKKQEEENEKERLAYASIEWHDFVVVESIEFTAEDEKNTLPTPMSLTDLESMSLAQKRMAAIAGSLDLPDFAAYEKKLQEELGEPEAAAEQEAPAVQAPVQPQPVDINAPIKIRTDYKPKILGQQARVVQEAQICPRCGEAIPANEFEEHMRIELLDPKWKEQKMAAEAKHKGTNLLQTGDDIARNLKTLSSYRTDIFGGDEVAGIGQKREKTAAASTSAPSVPISAPVSHADTAFANQLPMEVPATRKAPPTDMEMDGMPKRQRMDEMAPPPMHAVPPPAMPPVVPPAMPPVVPPAMPPLMPPHVPPVPHAAASHHPMSVNMQWTPESAQPSTIYLQIQTIEYPEKPEWHLDGSMFTVDDLSMTTLVTTVKDRIAAQINMPASRQKLMLQNKVMTNTKDLGFYGCRNGITLTLGVKDRKK